MVRGEQKSEAELGRAVVYCLVPRELAARLHEPLRRHFRDHSGVQVVVERRACERRAAVERRQDSTPSDRATQALERRRIRNPSGRRVGDRRAPLLPIGSAPQLPVRLRKHADDLVFVERVEPSAEALEDLDTIRLVTKIQAGQSDLFGAVYMRYFDRVYGYLRVLVRDAHEAEDLTQQVFVKLLEALPRYERRSQPFRAYLFTVVRNAAISHLRKHSRVDLHDPATLDRAREEEPGEERLEVLDWISDRDLVLFVERLPLPQRQVLVMRFMLDLTTREISELLERSPNEVSVLQYRALAFLRKRLEAVGRSPVRRGSEPIRRRTRPASVLRRRRFALRT